LQEEIFVPEALAEEKKTLKLPHVRHLRS